MKRGFTLAEVMVAMLFLSIAMFGYISLHMRILHSSTTLQVRHSIRRKVDLHISQLLAKAHSSELADGTYPLLLDEVAKEMLTPYLKPSGDDPGNNYTGEVQIQTQVSPPNVKHLTVKIQWTNRHGPQEYVVDTYVASKDAGW